jgi:hypothetical protein
LNSQNSLNIPKTYKIMEKKHIINSFILLIFFTFTVFAQGSNDACPQPGAPVCHEGTKIQTFTLPDGCLGVRCVNMIFDVDGDGTLNNDTDGKLILRKLFGFSDVDILGGIPIDSNAQRTAITNLNRLHNANIFDVDGDGTQGPLSDGIIIVRYMMPSQYDFYGNFFANLSLSRESRTKKEILDYLVNVRLPAACPQPGAPVCHEGTKIQTFTLSDGCLGVRCVPINNQTSSGFRSAYWQCYDGEEGYEGSEDICKSSLLWKNQAISFCDDHCSSESGKCGVNSFTLSNYCDLDDSEISITGEDNNDNSNDILSMESVINLLDSTLICTNSCPLDGKCYPFGYRKSSNFCSDEGRFIKQLEAYERCENNFQCASNTCVSNQCVSQGLIDRVISWFRNLFGG